MKKDTFDKTVEKAKSIAMPIKDAIVDGLNDVKDGCAMIPGKFRKRIEGLRDGCASMRGELIAYFNRHADRFRKDFDADSLFAKLGKVARTAGANVVYIVLVLYYSLLGKDVALKDRAMVIAALGYFIAPFDFIPDIFGLLGFADDFGVLMFVFRKIRDNVTPEVHLKAKEKLRDIFGDRGLTDLTL